jgi:hypothetical protein
MRTNLTCLRSFLTSAAFATAIAAGPEGRAATGDDPPPALATAPAEAVWVAGDPNVDRGFFLPTAMTQPAGTLTYSNYELLIHGLTYGISDHTQVSVGVLAPLVREMPFVGTVSLKSRVLDAGRFHLALQGTGAVVSDTVGILGAGVVGSYCLSADCASLFSASAAYSLGLPFGDDRANHSVIYGGALTQRLGRHVKLLVEVGFAAGMDGDGGGNTIEQLQGVLLNYGLRFHGETIAADVGFIRPVIVDADYEDPFVLGLPFVNFSYRW